MRRNDVLCFASTTLAALLPMLSVPVFAQTDRVTGEARRFLVYPVADLIDFSEREEGQFSVSYQVRPTKDGSHYFNVNVVRYPDEMEAVKYCNHLIGWHRGEGYQVSGIGGYACAFVADKRREEKRSDGKVDTFQLRTTTYVVGAYMGNVAEANTPLRPPPGPVGPLLAALKGEQPLSSGEIAFRNVLFSTGLKFGGDAARSCLDEVMNTAEAAAKDAKMADEIAQLRKAAAGAHAIEVLASVPVGPAHFDDFDPKWWDALKEVVPNPASTPDPQDTATDRVIDLLPPPLNVLVNIVRTGSKTMRAIKTHIADPAVHREVYACYHRKREGSGGTPIGENIGQAALESEAAQILHDAIGAGCNAPNSFKNSYEAQLRGFASKEARENEFTRLLRPLAVRFEFIYRVEDAKAHRETLTAGRWAPVQDILARLKVRVNACIADRASKAR